MTYDNLITTQERAFFFIIPNMVDDMGLSPYAFRLYAHMKRVAGETGACWQSTRTLADTCKMSTGKVSAAKNELREAGLITIETRKKQGGEYHHVTIREIMPQNLAKYSNSKKCSPHERECSPDERECSPDERECSPHETKKNQLRRTKEEDVEKPAAAAFSSSSKSEPGTIQERWKQRFMRDYFEKTGENAIEDAVALAVKDTIEYIAKEDYSMRYDYLWIEERLVKVLAKEKAFQGNGIPAGIVYGGS